MTLLGIIGDDFALARQLAGDPGEAKDRLARALAEGDDEAAASARKDLVASCLPFVFALALHSRSGRRDPLDRVDDAVDAAMSAAASYDPAAGTKYVTYAGASAKARLWQRGLNEKARAGPPVRALMEDEDIPADGGEEDDALGPSASEWADRVLGDERVSPRAREWLRLYHIEGLGTKEIARRYHRTPGEIQGSLAMSRRRLREFHAAEYRGAKGVMA